MKKFARFCLFYLFIFICSMFLFGINVYAYIDPSITTYAIQAIAGVLVAVGATAGFLIRKAKKKIQKKMNIDENSNKEVESDDIFK